jgi:hypothetical protein
MDEQPREEFIASHVARSDARTDAEATRLVTSMLSHSWPGGSSDRTEPGALEWIRSWGPRRIGFEMLCCTCPHQGCALCN